MFYRIGFAAVLLVAIVAGNLGAQAPRDTSRAAGPLKIITVVSDSAKKDCDCKLQAPAPAPVLAPAAVTTRGLRGYQGKQGNQGKNGAPGTDCTGQVPTVPPRTCFGERGADGRNGENGHSSVQSEVRAVNHHTVLWVVGGTIAGILVGTGVYCITHKDKCGGGKNENNNTNINNNGMVPLGRFSFP